MGSVEVQPISGGVASKAASMLRANLLLNTYRERHSGSVGNMFRPAVASPESTGGNGESSRSVKV